MGNFNSLRNIIILLVALFFTACKSRNPEYTSSGDIKSISSEDKYADVDPVGTIVDQETGQTIYVVAKK